MGQSALKPERAEACSCDLCGGAERARGAGEAQGPQAPKPPSSQRFTHENDSYRDLLGGVQAGQAPLGAYVAPPFEQSALQPPEAVQCTRGRPVQGHGLRQASATTIALSSLQFDFASFLAL